MIGIAISVEIRTATISWAIISGADTVRDCAPPLVLAPVNLLLPICSLGFFGSQHGGPGRNVPRFREASIAREISPALA